MTHDIIIYGFNFFILTIISASLLVFSRKVFPKKTPLQWFVLSAGVELYAVNRLLLITRMEEAALIMDLMAGAVTLIGVGLVLVMLSDELLWLGKREDELNAIIKHLKERLFKGEITKEEFNESYSKIKSELLEVQATVEQHKRKYRKK